MPVMPIIMLRINIINQMEAPPPPPPPPVTNEEDDQDKEDNEEVRMRCGQRSTLNLTLSQVIYFGLWSLVFGLWFLSWLFGFCLGYLVSVLAIWERPGTSLLKNVKLMIDSKGDGVPIPFVRNVYNSILHGT